MEEKVKEQLKFEIEVLRLCAVSLLTIGGGVVSLIVDRPVNGARAFFIAMGFMLLIFSGTFLYRSIKIIKQVMR
jgi:hypothetical protein